jgi:haloalkane dehalogenase
MHKHRKDWASMNFTEQFVQRGQHRIYVREYAGAEPTIVVMHGFPDNLHLYDRLIPHLSPPRRVVAFDFLGWGNSDKPPGYPTPPTIKSAISTPSSHN